MIPQFDKQVVSSEMLRRLMMVILSKYCRKLQQQFACKTEMPGNMESNLILCVTLLNN